MKFYKTLIALSIFAISGCELESQATFDAKEFDSTSYIPRNYQAAYADVLRGARKCWGSGPVVTAMPQATQLDAQLYPDLGYGEVYSYASGTIFMPQALVRIERSGDGSTVSVKTGPQAGKDTLFVRPPFEWATGKIECGSFYKK